AEKKIDLAPSTSGGSAESIGSTEPTSHLDLLLAFKSSSEESDAGYYTEIGLMVPAGNGNFLGPAVGFGEFSNEALVLSKAKNRFVSLLGKVRFGGGGSPSPLFLELGGGYYSFSHDLDPAVEQFCALLGTECEESIEGTFGGFVGGGVSFPVSESGMMGVNDRMKAKRPPVAKGYPRGVSTRLGRRLAWIISHSIRTSGTPGPR
ncbi:MAG: hypothetical protein L0170_01510, partial [Acidobacteria bacterium]|nr:hypothetical protein [Acidobacteriota bacterium]